MSVECLERPNLLLLRDIMGTDIAILIDKMKSTVLDVSIPQTVKVKQMDVIAERIKSFETLYLQRIALSDESIRRRQEREEGLQRFILSDRESIDDNAPEKIPPPFPIDNVEVFYECLDIVADIRTYLSNHNNYMLFFEPQEVDNE